MQKLCCFADFIVTTFIMLILIENSLIRVSDGPYFSLFSLRSYFFLPSLENVYFFTLKCHLRDKNTKKFPRSLRSLKFYEIVILSFFQEWIAKNLIFNFQPQSISVLLALLSQLLYCLNTYKLITYKTNHYMKYVLDKMFLHF